MDDPRNINDERILRVLRSSPSSSLSTISLLIVLSRGVVQRRVGKLRSDGVIKRIGNPRQGYLKVIAK